MSEERKVVVGPFIKERMRVRQHKRPSFQIPRDQGRDSCRSRCHENDCCFSCRKLPWGRLLLRVKQLQKVVPPSSIVHPPKVCLKWVVGMRVCQANETAIETKRRSSCPRCYGPRQHDELVGTTDGERGLHVVQEVVTDLHPARRANGKNTRQGLARRQREGIRLRISHIVGQGGVR